MDVQKAKTAFAYPVQMKLQSNWSTDMFIAIENNETFWNDEVFVTFEEPNLFDDPYNSVSMKIAAVVMWLVGFTGAVIMWAYVLYEKNGHAATYRTLITQLITCCYILVASYQTFAIGIDMIRAVFGPLPYWLCWHYSMLKGILSHSFPFVLLGVFIFKYLFLCVWKRMKSLEDDFIALYIIVTSLFAALLLQFIKDFGISRPSNMVVVCRGEFLYSESFLQKRLAIETPFVGGSFLACFVLTILVQIQRVKNIKLNEEQTFTPRNQRIPNQESFITSFFIVLAYLLTFNVVIYVNKQHPQDLGTFPVYIYVFSLFFVTPQFFVWICVYIILSRNSEGMLKVYFNK